MEYKKEDIKTIIEYVLVKMRKEQVEFFESRFDINERTLTAEMKSYLENTGMFKGYNIDCEYNRMVDDESNIQVTKRIKKCNKYKEVDPTYEDKKGKTIYPDIIIHKRGLSGESNNLVVIEVKKYKNKTNDNQEFDVCKLKALRDEGGKFGYMFAYFVVIGDETKKDKVCFVDDKECLDSLKK